VYDDRAVAPRRRLRPGAPSPIAQALAAAEGGDMMDAALPQSEVDPAALDDEGGDDAEFEALLAMLMQQGYPLR